MRIVLSDEAEQDLFDIYIYIAEFSPPAADALAAKFDRKLSNLLFFPFIGRLRPELRPTLRSVVVDNYVIFYMAERDALTIVRVLDGRRDINASLFR